MQLLIPGYIYPGAPPRTEWSTWIANSQEISGIIANPGSPGGPGVGVDTNYQAVIAAAQKAGIRVWGYVDDGYNRPDASATLVDDFNTTPNQSLLLRAGWFGSATFGENSLQTDATPTSATKAVPGTWTSNFFNTAFVDGEISVTLKTASAGGTDHFYLYNRCDVAGSNCYFIYIEMSGYCEMFKKVAGVSTSLGVTSGTGALAAGGKLTLRTYGTTVEVWFKPNAGTDTLIGRVTDSSISASGRAGIEIQDICTATFDSFSGGPIASIQKAQIDAWKTFYNINDIFFDQVTNGATDAVYMKLNTDYVKLTGGAQVMLNHGIDADFAYVALSDVQCTFEGTKTTYASYTPSQAWELGVPASRICHLVYNCTSNADVDAVISQAKSQNVGHVRAADTNSWFAQNAFFAEEIKQIDILNAPRSIAGWGVRSG